MCGRMNGCIRVWVILACACSKRVYVWLSAEAMEQLLARWGPSSNSSTSSDRSTSDSTSRTEDSPEPQHPDPSANVDTALSVHLRAMSDRASRPRRQRSTATQRQAATHAAQQRPSCMRTQTRTSTGIARGGCTAPRRAQTTTHRIGVEHQQVKVVAPLSRTPFGAAVPTMKVSHRHRTRWLHRATPRADDNAREATVAEAQPQEAPRTRCQGGAQPPRAVVPHSGAR